MSETAWRLGAVEIVAPAPGERAFVIAVDLAAMLKTEFTSDALRKCVGKSKEVLVASGLGVWKD